MTHLHAHSYFSFAYGTISAEELPVIAREHGMGSVALTDTNNVTGALEFYLAAKKAGVKPIMGAELKIPGESAVLLAKDATGYSEICQTITTLLQHYPKESVKVTFESLTKEPEVEAKNRSKLPLAAFLRELSDRVIILSSVPKTLDELAHYRKRDVFIELLSHQWQRFPQLRDVHRRTGYQAVVANDVVFADETEYSFHRMLRAIGLNSNLGILPPHEIAAVTQSFVTEKQLRSRFRIANDEAFALSDRIAEQCSVEFDLAKPKFARFDGDDPEYQLYAIAADGFANRYDHPTSLHRERFDFELKMIRDLGATSYFLAVHDMICYAKGRGFPYLGRGSGANSLIAYCLDISNVDPIENNLRFERFLNPERSMPPDFDIDFSWKDRYDVINYMLDTYGRDRSAMLCTINTYRNRSPIREVGKSLGFGEADINRMISRLSELRVVDEVTSSDEVLKALRANPDEVSWLKYASKIQGFPHHLSVHSGGVIIADRPMKHYTAIQDSPIGVPIMQQDMFTADEWKLIKLDILATRGLGTYWDTMKLVKERTGELPPVTDVRVALNDEATKAIIREGRTKGCFYVESPAMISLLKKLQIDTFLMLTAASSVIRPGVAQSGMMNEFIKRHHDPDSIVHIHPKMGELLAETYGVMIYQEDVLNVLHEIAGLSYGEADVFRRAMSGKLRSRDYMEGKYEVFLRGCARNDIEPEIAAELWRQIASFSGYSFCKAHSASYAVLSFQEAYLKCHYPAEFLCSVLNNYGGFYSHQEYINEAKRLGVEVRLPDINESGFRHTVDPSGAILVGFETIRSVSQSSKDHLLESRERYGPFTSIYDFLERSGVTPEDGKVLISLGAFDALPGTRAEKRIEYVSLAKKSFGPARAKANQRQQSLGLTMVQDVFDLSHLSEFTALQQFALEREYLGYGVTHHPYEFIRHAASGTALSSEVAYYLDKQVTVVGYNASTKYARTKKGEQMCMLNLTDADGTIDVVIWPRQFKQFYSVISTSKALRVTGTVRANFGVLSLMADKIEGVEFKS